MLSEIYPSEKLNQILLPRTSWHPYPTAEERDTWAALPEAVRASYIARGEAALDFTWPVAPATLFLEYARNGNRSNYQSQVRDARRNTLRDLVLAECLEGNDRFLDQIVNGVWVTCEESFWGVPAHLNRQKAGTGLPDITEPIVDLFAAEAAALLAWTAYLLAPQLNTVSSLVVPRIEHEIDRRILTPLIERDDFSWMGFNNPGRRVNNWNPWICSNWLICALIVEKDENRRQDSVSKAMRTVDNFIDPYPRDGGCDEGPGYWNRAGASLFDCLELLHSATDGAIDLYDNPLIREIARFIYRVQIRDDYFVNFADASALIVPSAPTLYRFGQRIDDPHMIALGAWAARHQDLANRGSSDSLGRQLPALFCLADLLQVEPRQPLPRDVWLPDIQVLVARDTEGSSEGFYIAAKGGNNNESHNHNDIGNVVVYIHGKPVLVDAGVEAYTAKTFSSTRYDIWTMQSAYHTLPTVNGVQQAPGAEYAAQNPVYKSDDQKAELTLDIASAYPEGAGINTWVRSITLNRSQDIFITDTYNLKAVTGPLTLSLLTPCEVTLASGLLTLKETPFGDNRITGAAQVHYNSEKFTVTTESIPIHDERLGGVWGNHLNRILLTAGDPPTKDTWTLRVTT